MLYTRMRYALILLFFGLGILLHLREIEVPGAGPSLAQVQRLVPLSRRRHFTLDLSPVRQRLDGFRAAAQRQS